jgi:hypothetical protein
MKCDSFGILIDKEWMMTITDQLDYGSFAEHVELREDIVRRAYIVWARAVRLRNAMGVVAVIVAALELAGLFFPVRHADWPLNSEYKMAVGWAVAWLLAVVNAWFCQRRLMESQDRFIDYVSGLPIQRTTSA